MKKAFISLFLLILFSPMLLGIGTKLSGKTLDVPLKGYTDSTEKPVLSLSSLWSGQFQSDYTAWYQENFQPRGIFTKNYTTLRYNLFHLDTNGRVVGKDHDIFEMAYINAELCINGASDFSQPEAQAKAQEYVAKLELLQDKLAKFGKSLYIVMAPSKADFHRENIPDKYVIRSDPDAIPGQDYLAELLNTSDIPHLICAEQKDSLEYPPFYCSGIHWSRTFEQETLTKVLADLADTTGKAYPQIELGDVTAQDTPFWRDADVFHLTNVWNPYTETYYQYDMSAFYPENYENLGILFHGTSFSLGFYQDFTSLFPMENTVYVNRSQYYRAGQSGETKYFKSFDEISLLALLDQVNAVVVEILPANIENYSWGFVDALLESLDSYVPNSYGYMASLDVTSPGTWDTTYLKGLYGREGTSRVWTHKESQITIRDTLIQQQGLELAFKVPAQFFKSADTANVKIYINGVQTLDLNYQEAWSGSMVISPEQLPQAEDGKYTIRLVCDSSFIPAVTDGTADTRELSLVLTYIGRVR